MRPKPELGPADARRAEARYGLRLRIACTATCGSCAHAWMHMSPPEIVRLEQVAGEERKRLEVRRAPVRDAEPVRPRASKSVGPKPIVIVSPLGGRPSASPVSSGGGSRAPSTAPSPTLGPRSSRAAAHRPLLSSSMRSSRSPRYEVERGEVQAVLDRRRRCRPGAAVERVRRRPDRGRRRVGARRRAARRRRRRSRRRRRRRRAIPERRAPGEPAFRRAGLGVLRRSSR